MLTNNYWKMIYCYGKQLDNEISFTCINGNVFYLRMSNNGKVFLNTFGMIVGSGTTAPTPADTSLSNQITDFVTVSSSVQTSYNENGLKIVGTITGNNNSSSSRTINEVGLTFPVMNAYGNPEGYALAARALLSEPIVVPPSQGFSITLEINEA